VKSCFKSLNQQKMLSWTAQINRLKSWAD